ncbi:MAG: hypothetical protein QXJ64_08440 [Thermosphaera sp.]
MLKLRATYSTSLRVTKSDKFLIMAYFTAFRTKLFYPYHRGAEYVLLIRRFCGEVERYLLRAFFNTLISFTRSPMWRNNRVIRDSRVKPLTNGHSIEERLSNDYQTYFRILQIM